MKKKKQKKQISHVNQDWYWTQPSKGVGIEVTNLKWWERIFYWKWHDRSIKLN